MRNKKIILVIVATVVLAVFPLTAFANAPEPSPGEHYVLIDDYENISAIKIILYFEEGSAVKEYIGNLIKTDNYKIGGFTSTRIQTERVFKIYDKSNGKLDGFSLEITFKEGEVKTSNKIEFEEWSNYRYNVSDNTLSTYGRIASAAPDGFSVVSWAIALLLPLGLTLFFEWLVAKAFKIKPLRYIVFANLVSNPLMNIIIIIILIKFYINYLILILAIEMIVFGLEYLYYKFKYKDINKWRLLLFAFTANAVSWGAYAVLTNLFY